MYDTFVFDKTGLEIFAYILGKRYLVARGGLKRTPWKWNSRPQLPFFGQRKD